MEVPKDDFSLRSVISPEESRSYGVPVDLTASTICSYMSTDSSLSYPNFDNPELNGLPDLIIIFESFVAEKQLSILVKPE